MSTCQWLRIVCVCAAALGCDDSSSGAEGESEGEGKECKTTEDCKGELVCDPGTGTCDTDVPCESHDDCGNASFCGEGSICEESQTGSPCATNANCMKGQTCQDSGYCGCGGELYSATAVPPNVLIALDRSGSMDGEIDGTSKWDIALTAIATVLDAFGDQVRFGLMAWPGSDQSCDSGVECGAGTVFIDPAGGTAEAINAFLADSGLCSLHTPIAATLSSLLPYAGLEDPERANYVLLITDGQENCLGDPVPQVMALRDETPEVKTFVVGFAGDPDEVDPDMLADMAMAGGTALPDDPYYYAADSSESLLAALTDIAGSVLSCSYELSEVPPDIADLYVFIDEVLLPRDTSGASGWDYDAATNQILFAGETCAALQAGTVEDLAIVYGCPQIPIK